MAISQGSQSELRYVAETAFGVTPATPETKILNRASFDLSPTINMVENTIRGNHQKYAPQHGNFSATGNFASPLIFGGFDDFIAGALGNVWVANTVKNGTQKPTFTFEGAQKDIASYRIARGCYVNQMGLTFANGANVEATFDLIGKSLEITGTPLDASPTAAVSADNVMKGILGSVTEGGTNLGTVTTVSLTVANNAELAHVYGSNSATDFSTNAITVTGTLTVYWTSSAMLQKFVSGTRSSLAIVASDGVNSYTFNLPNITYTGGNAPVNSQGNLTLELPFEATVDNVTGYTISVARTGV